MPATTVTSEAYNLSSISTAVNNRTGGVDISVSLGQISSGLQDPATFKLMIYSNPGSPSQNTFGLGGNWLINSPRIDFRNKIIYLGDGKTVRYADNFALNYHRIKNIKIEPVHIIEGTASYWNYIIHYKNGSTEYYNELGAITKLVSASGNYLNFTYESHPGEVHQALSKVDDDQGNELSIDYGIAPPGSTERIVTVTQFVAGERSTTKVYIQRTINTDIVKSISLPNNFSQRFFFDYIAKEDNLVYLSKITKPTGQAEAFTYSNINYNANQTIGVVSKLEVMGNDPAQSGKSTITYEYSNENFTGYPLVNTQVPGRDNCIYRTDDFTYTVIEVHGDIKIKRTFNRFHLIAREECIDSLSDIQHSVTTFTYPIVANADINGQPENYSHWTRKSTVYRNLLNNHREIYETRSFDAFGNLLSHRELSGITTTNTYYPADSKLTDGCPPTPIKYFVCHLKRSEIKPESSAAGGEMKILEIKYKEVVGLRYTSPVFSPQPTIISPYMVRAVESKTNGIILSTADYISATDNTPASARIFVGMQQWEKLPSVNNPYTTTHTYSKVGALAKIHTSHSSGVLVKNTSKTFSLATGLTLAEEDFSGAKTEYQYDSQNRLIKEVNFSGTDWAQEKTYTYDYYKNIDTHYGYQNTVTVTDSRGMQFTSYFNFNNQLSYVLETFPQGVAFCVKKLEYFASGLIASETEYDKVSAPSGMDVTVANTTSYTYQSRELVRIIHPDETTSSVTRDKVLNTEDYRQQDGAVYRKTYDSAGNVTSIAIVTRNGIDEALSPIEQSTYDGFGRNLSTINRTGGRSSFEYDQFDRLIKEKVYDTDGKGRLDSNAYTYDSDLQNMNLAISVISTTSFNAQQEVMLDSRRTHDAFGRLIQQDDQTFHYTQPYYNQPSSADVYDSAKTSTMFDTTTLATNEVVKEFPGAPDIKFKYTYDKKNGSVSRAQAYRSDLETSKFEYTYDAKGGLIRTDCTYASGTSITTKKSYSVSGDRVTTATNHLGKSQSYHYDFYGRLWTKKYGDLNISITAAYNEKGALAYLFIQSPTFTGADEFYLAIMMFEYNASNFESRRNLKIKKNTHMSDVLDTRTVYDVNGLVASRHYSKTSDAADDLDRSFTYLGAYGHLRSSTMKKGTAEPSVTNYGFAGGQRFSSIATTNNTTQEYIYRDDQVAATTDGVEFTNFNSDFLGNITNGPDTGTNSRFFEYDAANSLRRCSIHNERTAYEYLYDPFGKISQILQGSECITYVYDGDTVIGEVSGNTKTLYLSFGDIVVGRYILRGEQAELELFGTDSAGTVRCVTTCYPVGGDAAKTIYYDYSDFGERQAW